MNDLRFIKDKEGRIIKAVRDEYYANIKWEDKNADIEFCNFVITIVLTARGVGLKDG